MSYFFKNTLDLPIVCRRCGHEYTKIFKEEQPIEILKMLGLKSIEILKMLVLITNIEEYQKI